jgi:subtilisin family serine protease
MTPRIPAAGLAVVMALLLCGCKAPKTPTVYLEGTPIYADQDKPFEYTVTSPETGDFTIDNLPSYASFDGTTGKLTGVLHAYSDQFVFMLTQHRATGDVRMGPYRVHIVGNPLKDQQWHLRNTGQTAYAGKGGTAGEDIHLTDTIYNGITGTGIRIAVSDTGVLINHEGLTANVLEGESRDYLNDYDDLGTWIGDPTPDLSEPDNAHGTAVAGLIAEEGWNGIGGRGVAPDAHFAGFLFLQAQDHLMDTGYYTEGILDQFDGDFDIFNYSWGDAQCALSEYPSLFFSKLEDGVTNLRGGKGAIYVQAAGNSYVDDLSTCYDDVKGEYYGNAAFSDQQSTPYIMTVGALNADGVSSSYSSPGANLWISAPGGEYGFDMSLAGVPEATEPAMISTDFPGCDYGLKTETLYYSSFNNGSGNPGCNYTNSMNGTSSASPVVSGAVALLLQANPNLTWRDVKYILASTADKVDPDVNPAHHPDPSLDLSGHVYEQPWVTNTAGFHFHNYYGFGRINVDNAVAMATGFVSPLGTFTKTGWKDSGTINVSIPDADAAGAEQTLDVTDTLTIEAVKIRVSVSDCVSDIGLELTAPSGVKSILMNINSGLMDEEIGDHQFMSNAFYGESSAGTWTLKVIDGHTGCNASLTNWQLNIFGY